MIGLSPLSTAHPLSFQPKSVRPFTRFYARFSLAMDRSPSFGSTGNDYIALFRLAFATAPCVTHLTSPHPVTRRLIMQKARRQLTGTEVPGRLRPLVSRWFQVLFHSPPGVLFTFPSRYLSAIGRRRVFSLRRWSSQIPTGFHVSRSTWVPIKGERTLSRTGLSPSLARLSRTVLLEFPQNPHRTALR